jgi:hypothetical protein
LTLCGNGFIVSLIARNRHIALSIRCCFLGRLVMSNSNLIGLLLAACAALLVPSAQAQTPARSYAVISEMAREVSVVIQQDSTGSRLNNNSRQRIPVPEGALEKVALVAGEKALKKATPDAKVCLLAPADTDFFTSMQTVGEGSQVKIPDDLAAAFRERGSSHLLLFSRWRGDANLQLRDNSDGAGKLDGLGYYIDRSTRTRDTKTGLVGDGYLAPFAYFRISLIDVANGKVVGTREVQATTTISAGVARGGSTHPWDALTPSEKMTQLRDMLINEIDTTVPKLAAKP